MPRLNPAPAPPDAASALRIVAGLAKIGLVMRHAQWTASGRRGLTPTQSQILAIIAASPAPLGLKALAQQLAVTLATASEAVAALVEKRLIRKQADHADGRAVLLQLTARGSREASTMSQWPTAIVQAAQAMPLAERAILLRGLVGMVRTMEDRGLVPMARMCAGCQFFRPNEYPALPKPHHCLFIDAPIGDTDLRIDCADMQPIAPLLRPRLWEVFLNGKPLDHLGPGQKAARRARPRSAVAQSRRTIHSNLKGVSS